MKKGEKFLHKESQKLWDAYILGIPYNGKVITDKDIELLESIPKYKTNEKFR